MSITIDLSEINFGLGCMWLAAGFIIGCAFLASGLSQIGKQ
jgi:hypothetical protein